MLRITKGYVSDYFSVHNEGTPAYKAPASFMRLEDNTWSVRRSGDLSPEEKYFHGLTAQQAYEKALSFARLS
jgi:hypothetical protein